ncbi:MAG TPA: site-2 protease family protein [Pyrinomonadaceae bacterium]|jgi:Zn-dependent protease|nr:site-2 protease family protein [Pyrinomonadaceae bacterium]
MRLNGIYKRTITVARIFGIPVRFDYRWFIVFVLSIWLIAANLSRGGMLVGTLKLVPLSVATAWILAVVVTVGLFLSVLGHELSHALMARAEGIEIEEIVLHPFGGLARLRNEPDSARAEFRIAVAGPAASFLFALISFILMLPAIMAGYETAGGVLFLLCAGNLLLAVFNLFPGYPLDGGRVLRAILWGRTGDIKEATRLAGICGMLIAAILIIFGVYMVIAPSFRSYFMGFWSVLVGLFLFDAAYSVVKHVRGRVQNIVKEAMSAPFSVEPDLLISQLIDSVLPMHRQVAFPVALNKRLHGIVSLDDLKTLPRERWHLTKARDVMRPIAPRFFVEPNATLDYARELMKRNGIGSLAVVGKNGELVGFLQSGRFKRKKQRLKRASS